MAQTIGVVVETRGDGRATVVAEKAQGCGSCSAVSGCHGGRAGSAQKTQVLNRIGAAVGDRVTLTVDSGPLLARMAVLYLVPVFGMLTGAFSGAFLSGGVDGSNSGRSIAFGLGGFVLGLLISVVVSRVWSSARPVLPVVTRIVSTRLTSISSHSSAGCSCDRK